MINIFRLLLTLLARPSRRGSVTVSAGQREIRVHTCFTPDDVWVNLEPSKTVPVCHASPDCFDVTIVPGGFILICNIKSEHRKVKWIAIG